MARTVFVNPGTFSNPRKRRKHGKRRAKRRNASLVANPRRRRRHKRARRRNAGITPFIQNPLIMSNPKRRRKARNPLAGLSMKSVLSRGLTYSGGAAIAVGANVLVLNGIDNFWARNGARFGSAVLGAMFLKGDLGASFAGASFYPIMQEMAGKFLPAGISLTGAATPAAAATEADMEALAADLQDVMDDLDADDLEDDDILG